MKDTSVQTLILDFFLQFCKIVGFHMAFYIILNFGCPSPSQTLDSVESGDLLKEPPASGQACS